MSPSRLVYPIFFVSGMAGLLYQVVWVREFGLSFGNTVHSAALVTAVFMLGLGAGSYLFGSLADRRGWESPRLLSAYAYLELAIAALGFIIALIMPRLEVISAATTSYVANGAGWLEPSTVSHLMRFGLCIAILAPSTVLMGGTLTVLIRALVHDQLSQTGWRVGLLFGLNTAGAALGTLLVDMMIVPSVGLFATQAIAVLLNLVAGLAALRLAAAWEEAPAPSRGEQAQERPPAADDAPETSGLLLGVSLAVFSSGAAAMGLEILWFRFLSSVLGSYRFVFSLLLAVILVGMWLGSLAAGWLERRHRRPLMFYSLAQVGMLATALGGLALHNPELKSGAYLLGLALPGPVLNLIFALAPILLLVGLPSFFMGFAYPLANAAVQRHQQRVGRRAGFLYLANTSGAVVGSMAAGFFLLPRLGLQGCALVLAASSTVSLVFLAWARTRQRPAPSSGRPGWALVGVGALMTASWLFLPADHLAMSAFTRAEQTFKFVSVKEGLVQSVAVVESGQKGAGRTLYTDGHLMSGTADNALRYMRAMAHIPLLLHEHPSSALVICFGVGNTVHAVSLHPTIKRLEVADLSRAVVEQAGHFERWNRGVINDPRLAVHINDGRQHLRTRPERTYDLITLEPPPLTFAGVGSLYSAEFYRLAWSRLSEGGFMTQWLPAYQVDAPVSLAMTRAFVDTFPGAVLVSGYGDHLILVGRRGAPISADPSALKRRLEQHKGVLADLKNIHMGTVTDLVGSFAGGYDQLARAVEDVDPLTDDLPINEYGSVRFKKETSVPASLIDVSGARTWCPACFQGVRSNPQVPRLRAYLALTSAFYNSEKFLRHGRAVEEGKRVLSLPMAPAMLQDLMRRHRYLTGLFPTLRPGRLEATPSGAR